MADFTISQERVQNAVNVIVQFLRDSGYEGSLEDGTGLNDVVVKPNAVIYELIAQMVDKARAYQSLQKAYELKDIIGEEEYDDAVDSILSNWFVTRNDGKPSSGLVRLWFLQPLSFVHYVDGQVVGTVDDTTLVADTEQVFTEESFSCILNTTDNQNEYYIDIQVRTAENSDIAPTTESSVSVSVSYNDIYFLRSTIPGTFTAGTLMESSEDFIARTEQVITTRELITARAINTVLLDNFADIIRLYVARHGSSEQLRDIVEFQKVLVHVGNKADIYIASQITKQTIEVIADEEGFISIDQLPTNVTIVGYVKAVSESASEDLNLQITCYEPHWCSHNYLPDSIQVGTSGSVQLTILTDNLTSQIHDFVYSDEQRVACYDPMVKHMFPLVLKLNLNVDLIDETIDSEDAIKEAVIEYVNYLVEQSQPWVASELVASVHVRVKNVKKIYIPLDCTGTIFDPLRQKLCTFELGNRFTINNGYTEYHSKQITDNTVQFYTDKDLITVTT